jgi:hypothetical protein
VTARRSNETSLDRLRALRFEVFEAAHILRMSRARLYNRIHEGSICRKKTVRANLQQMR